MRKSAPAAAKSIGRPRAAPALVSSIWPPPKTPPPPMTKLPVKLLLLVRLS
jgi:hypothetical protein